MRDEAHRLKPLGGQPSFGSLRELTRVVGNDCAIEIDTNSYSVTWRLIGERVAVTVAAGEVRIRATRPARRDGRRVSYTRIVRRFCTRWRQASRSSGPCAARMSCCQPHQCST
ncbi:Mu transposase domain-containing protein [Bradyrhizobium macuxiense]|uniref:Mu transposase domain-containing protein n=1 Tax=Bradyrhizobium macuxiense TaxID=1755647 RepID=UPI003D323315